MSTANPANRLQSLRSAIDSVDDELQQLLAYRARHATEIGELKRDLGLPVRNDAREAEVYRRLCDGNRGPLGNDELSAIMTRVIEACRRVQAVERVACLGPQGSFSSLTAASRFGAHAPMEFCGSLSEVFEAVAEGRASQGVVPADNTLIGPVEETREALTRHPTLRVREALVRDIELVLLVRPGTTEIREVHSKPEALAQCRERLATDYADATTVDASSTSAAARLVAALPLSRGAAAVASVEAGERHGLVPYERGPVSDGRSSTVFWVIERIGDAKA
ncbi:MAG: prephenate dehydratase domain-containing protein [Myxococcota bacterium]